LFELASAAEAPAGANESPTLVRQGRWKLERPTELFLGSKLAVHMLDGEALDMLTYAAAGGSGTIGLRVVFPHVCTGCLEPTTLKQNRSLSLIWETVQDNTRRTTTISSGSWPLPMCVRCTGYGLAQLFEVKTDVSGGLWISFRFPNLAYYEPFVTANGLTWGERVAPTGAFSGRHEQKARDTKAIDAGIAAWALVRDGLGFHRYVELKTDLLELDDRFGARAVKERPDDVRAALDAFMRQHEVEPEQLREVARIANREFRVLESLGA
jgi:hypothetical protein